MITTRPAGLDDRLAGYAARLRAAGAIRSEPVERAFATVQRHRCLRRFQYGTAEYVLDPNGTPDGEALDLIYADHALTTRTGRDGDPPSRTTAPSLMARMLEALDLRPGHRVLEIGAGTAYNAALVAHITGAEVTTVESNAVAAAGAGAAVRALDLDDQVRVIHRDGYAGHPANGSYDRIIVTCGIAGIPPLWLDQLAPGGMILAPLAHAGVHPVFLARRHEAGELVARVALWADFPPATGLLHPPGLLRHGPAVAAPADEPADPVLTAEEYNDLWFFLGTEDRRITRARLAGDQPDPSTDVCALVDPLAGTACIRRDGTTTLVGAEHLRGRLMIMTDQWEHLRRPAATRWSATFRHVDTGAAGLLRPHRWHLCPFAV